MSIDNKVREGARNAVRICMNVKAPDRVFVLSDDDTLNIGQALVDEAKAVRATVELRRLEEFGKRPFTSVPEELIRRIDEFSPSVTFYAAGAQKGELALRMGLTRHLLGDLGVRHGHMIGITAQIMREGMRADYKQVYALTGRVYEIVRKAKSIHVTSHKGSDLTARFSSKFRWVPCHGLYHEQGEWGNLPEGEVYTCPASVDGVVVADVLGDHFSEKYGVLVHPVTFEIVKGSVKQVRCSDKGIEAEVWEYLKSSKNGRRVGEFAIGTNTSVNQLIGRMLQDEKIPGIHVAFGNPYPLSTGAKWTSQVHVDVVPTGCTIQVDGTVIMADGKFVIS